MIRVRFAFLLGALVLMPACGRTEHRDASAPPTDAGVESARPLADSAIPSADGAGPAVEAAIPVTADGAADRTAGDSLAPDIATVAPDAVPDGPVDASPDAGLAQGDGAGGDAWPTCWYLTEGEGQAFQHFRFSFVAPDQTTYACPAGAPVLDAAAQWPTVLTGLTTSVSDSEFTIDTCLSAGACSPSLYSFKLDAPGAKLTMPVGRQVKVFWQISARGTFGCSHWLAATDAEPGPTLGMVWFLGNGGFMFPVSNLPFNASLKTRSCGPPSSTPRLLTGGVGDYAFSFASDYGPASSLELGTGEDGLFTFTTGQGTQQTLDIHSLDAFQPTSYAPNFDYWAVNQTPVPPPSDGGTDSGTLDLETALCGKTLTYWVTTEWGPSDGGFRTFVPAEQDYVTVTPYAKDSVVFSADGSAVQVTAVQGGSAPVAGTRTSTDQGRWTYRLEYFAGGELVVWSSGTTILASETRYGSGVPVIESTRGELRAN